MHLFFASFRVFAKALLILSPILVDNFVTVGLFKHRSDEVNLSFEHSFMVNPSLAIECLACNLYKEFRLKI